MSLYKKVSSNRRAIVDMVFLVFAKAFGSVSHRCLMYKLRSIGFKNIVYNLIEKWLKDHLRGAVVNDLYSEWFISAVA